MLADMFFFAACCEKLVISHDEDMTNVSLALPSIFTIYEIENTTINGRPQYTSVDGAQCFVVV